MLKINNEKPLITIVLLSFNHEKYIEKALNSIIMQVTSYDCKIIIVDDFSSDKTRLIIKKYKEKYPFIILAFNNRNIGASLTLFNLHSKIRSKYITILEGDDYWVTNYRIEVLVKFLEEHSEYIGVSHRRSHINLNNTIIGQDPNENLINKPFSLKDFIYGRRFSISGSVYRNIFYKLKDYKKMYTIARNVSDFQTTVLLLKYGVFFVLDEILSVYLNRSSNGESNYNSINSFLSRYYDHIKIIRATEDYFQIKHMFINEKVILNTNVIIYYIKRFNIRRLIFFIFSLNFTEFFSLIINLPFNLLKRIIN
jgi:glycosyltransferase involved in cell wall biosynthesis